jgi:hypothetical protein
MLDTGLHALHDQVTLIPQEPELFNSTVEDNITMDIKVDSHDLERVIGLAQFQSVLDRLPDGLQTNVMEKGDFIGDDHIRDDFISIIFYFDTRVERLVWLVFSALRSDIIDIFDRFRYGGI